MATNQLINILLVEDDDVDAMAFRRHFDKSSLPTKIHHVVDGVDALSFLRERPNDQDAPLIIFLDLNMPRMSGDEFLAELRNDPMLRSSVVFVLTTSDAASDLKASYEKNVAGYVLKSRVGEKFENLIALMDAYHSTIEFPPAATA